MCRHWIKYTAEFQNVETGEIITMVKYAANKQPYHVALHQLEHFISKIVTANFRKSWIFNQLLNHSRFTPFYWRLKSIVFRADEVITS